MIYNKHYLNVILRVSLITITCMGIAFSHYSVHEWLLTANLVLLLVLQIRLFIRAMNKINTDLETFFTALENNDTTVALKVPEKDQSYRKLLDRMDRLRKKFNQLRMENERQFHYFKAVVENIGVGLILCDKEGRIELINNAGKKLLDMNSLKTLQALDIYNETISATMLSLNSGDQKMFRLHISGNTRPIAFKVNDHRFFDKTRRIISFQNIKSELDAQELESWQKLIRVLTHEIMNSTGPIISSIDTIREFLTEDGTKNARQIKTLDQETIVDVLTGIEIIKERSIGLSEFVKNFRSLTISPLLKPQKFNVEELFTHVRFLLSEEIKNKGITLNIIILPKNLEIIADLKLMEQVILNLVYNAMDALENVSGKQISLLAHKNLSNQPVIQVTDNGRGISEEILDKIFIPFFTTREKGSGIGLSISRQIIQMHGGSIFVMSVPGKETCVEICFGE